MSPEETSDLLKTFAATRCEAAFRALVEAYAGPVQATALRVAGGDAALAEDAAQGVFAELARHPRAVRDGRALAAWLHRCATRRVTGLLLSERRRRKREAAAHSAMHDTDDEPHARPDAPPPDLTEEIDLALDRLGHTDRWILTLRYWREESWSAIAETVSLSEDAAQKRASRALEKMRRGLSRRGVTGTAAALTTALSFSEPPAVSAAVVSRITSHALSDSAPGSSPPRAFSPVTGSATPPRR